MMIKLRELEDICILEYTGILSGSTQMTVGSLRIDNNLILNPCKEYYSSNS